jgi:hypothetical protein
MSTLISCPRAVALEEKYDLYEPIISGYNKGRGSWVHAMLEVDRDPPPWIIRERRLYLEVNGVRVTGQPDEVDTKYKVLVDYKSKDNLPLKPDLSHEFQFNGYAHLLRNGYWTDTNERADINVDVIAAHYVTWKTKLEKAWFKMPYPVWDNDYTQEVIENRLAPLTAWRSDGILPSCSPYVPNQYYKCQCTKWEMQLTERGITIE